MDALKRGSRGAAVTAWQQFLYGQGFDPKGADGKFGGDTETATRAFQKKVRLPENGVVDDATYGKAAALGHGVTQDWPPRPAFAQLGHAQREALFGAIAFAHAPRPDSYEDIRITNGWDRSNLETVTVPQLVGKEGANARGRVTIHRAIAPQFRALWAAWDDSGLLGRVLTWSGAYNARFIRGQPAPGNEVNAAKLSNHSWGTAFDINYAWNKLGAVPALSGQKGCVRELVAIAHQHGFYWGGHFRGRPDGMHFEAAQVKP